MKKRDQQMVYWQNSQMRAAHGRTRRNDKRQLADIAVTALGMAAAVTLPWQALAAEWTAQASLGVTVGRVNNPALTPGVDENVNITQLAPRLQIEGASETAGLKLDLAVDVAKYSSSGIEDTNSQSLALSSFTQATERSRIALDAGLRREFLFEPVAATSGTGDLQNTDVGLAQTKVRRDGLFASPSWSYALTELSGIRLGYRADDVQFTNAVGTGVVDYKQSSFSGEYGYKIGAQDDLGVSVSMSSFRPVTGTNESDTLRLLLGWAHRFSEKATGRVSVGPSRTTEKGTTGDQDTSGIIVEASATQRSELTTLDAVISSDVQPSGAGRSVKSDQLRINYAYKITSHSELGLRGFIFRNKALEGTDPDDRRYVELAPGYRWQFAPEWSVSAAYVFRKQKFDADPRYADGNAVYIGMSYASPRFGASR